MPNFRRVDIRWPFGAAVSRRMATLVLLVLIVAVRAWSAETPQKPDEPPVWTFVTMHHHPWFTEVVVASLIGWVLGMVKGFASAAEWLSQYWPNPPKVAVFLLDLIVFVAVGGYFGTAIYNPSTLPQALAAGVSWPVGLGALATKNK